MSADGVMADPAKVRAITEMQQPSNVSDVRRVLCMANQLGKFSAKLSTTTQPLCDLRMKENLWRQQRAFDAVETDLSSTPVLALYDPYRTTTVSADASSFGLGAVLLQSDDGEMRLVTYASRAMTPKEQATTWALERFTDYLYGMQFHVETDH